ncbi:MAG: hypothetical protein WDW38_004261 [Sanguina aurantia]
MLHKRPNCRAWPVLLLLCCLSIPLRGGANPNYKTPVRVAFLTDCTMYSNWQSLGVQFSFKMSGQPGSVMRVACCTDAEKLSYEPALLASVPTHIAPSMAINPHNNDHYAAYNKPYAVIDWLDHTMPTEEFVLVLDSDMILRRPFFVEQLGPKKGLAVGARYTYMIGVNNELADRHIPEIAKRNDTLAGPAGRRADQVGGFFFIHRDDLKAMSHNWLKYSEDVRFDDQAYRLSGDVYAITPGAQPWISEMYGYAFAAAKANVWHKWDISSMIYPEYEPRDGIPKLLHYGLMFDVGNYTFDKHWHYDFDVTKCPPWDLTDPKHRTAGVFEHPPRPSTLVKKTFISYYKDLICIETVATLNAGFCDYHLSHCPPSEQLVSVCREAVQIYNEVVEALKVAEAEYDCQDFHPKCTEWARDGECERNEKYMIENCRASCDKCEKEGHYVPITTTHEISGNLEKMQAALLEISKNPDQTADVLPPVTVADPDVKDSDPDAQNEDQKAKEEKVLVVPHQTENDAASQTSTDALAEGSDGSPSPSPVVESPVLGVVAAKVQPVIEEVQTAAKVISEAVAQEAAVVTEAVARAADPSPKAVKECIAAAQKGNEYTIRAGKAPEDVVLTTKSEEDSGNGVTAESHRDQEDLALASTPVILPSTPAAGASARRLIGSTSGLGAFLGSRLGLSCVGVVLILAIAVPRVLQNTRRARSGMRTE